MTPASRGFTNVLILLLLHILAFKPQQVDARQKFRVKPKDQRVPQGHMLVFKCVVDNIVGTVQWSRKGIILGDERDLPGFKRFSMTGSVANGEYNLMITQATLDDDGEYQCQVSPDPTVPGSQLMARAYLTVLVPADPPVIQGHENATIVKVPHTQKSIKLVCLSRNGRPAAKVYWIKNGRNVTSGVQNEVTAVTDKLFTTKSTLTIQPQFHAEENNAIYTCSATNEANTQLVQKTTVKLSIQYPPGPPEITGYQTGDVLNSGETHLLKCIAKIGNPPGSVIWQRGTEDIDFRFTQDKTQMINEMVLVAKPEDNNVTYRCLSSNLVIKKPLIAQVKLTVHFAPKRAVISGKNLTKVGRDVTLTCVSDNSNPAAEITWFYSGTPINQLSSSIRPSASGGYITTSKVKVRLSRNQRKAYYECKATNRDLARTVSGSFTITAQYPPGKPVITGYRDNQPLKPGQVQRLICTSIGGNPPPKLSFYKGNKKLAGALRYIANQAILEVNEVMQAKDNQAVIKCKAKNLATSQPLVARVKISIHFPPERVNVTVSSSVIRVGNHVTLTCQSSSSNPAADIVWLQDGIPIAGTTVNHTAATHGGKKSISQMDLVPDPGYNGRVYGCRAVNQKLVEAVHDAITLNVLFKPLFDDNAPTKIDVESGKSVSASLMLFANPSNITYALFRGARKMTDSRFKIAQGRLNVTRARKSDRGVYTIRASNNEGTTMYNVTLNVLYAASIKSAKSPVSGDVNAKVELNCTADANPYKDDMVTWSREDFDMTKTKQEYFNGTSTLTVYDLTVNDIGKFVCTAFNGIGSKVTRRVQLIVNHKPMIVKSPAKSKSASDKGKKGVLTCTASGAPAITFKWYKDGKIVDLKKRSKYRIKSSKSQLINYTSVLTVNKVKVTDYGNYTCRASNAKGNDSFSIMLDGTSKPDPPYNVRFVNTSHNSITISWSPGFDGGLPQRFMVRHREAGDHLYVYVDIPHGHYVYTATGLKLDTEYELSVKAINSLGYSKYQKIPVMAKTDSVVPHKAGVADHKGEDDVPLIIILVVCIVGIFLLALNVALILFFIRRRKKRLENNRPIADGSDSTSQTNTIELYGPSKETALYPFTETDAHSYTSYGKNLDDFRDDLNRTYDPEDDVKRVFLPPHDYSGRPYPIDERDSHVAVYRDDPDRHSPWAYDGHYRAMTPTHTNSFKTYSDVYHDKPRQYDQDTRPKILEADANVDYEGGFVPAPPQRSSSHETYPPLPSRNYSPQGISPRYVPPPGAVPTVVSNQSQRGQAPTRTLSPTSENPELLGRLV